MVSLIKLINRNMNQRELFTHLAASALEGETDLGLARGLLRNLSGVSFWKFLTSSAADLNLLAPVSAEWRLLRTPADKLKGIGWVTPTDTGPVDSADLP